MAQLALGVALGTAVVWRLMFEMQRDIGLLAGHSPSLLAIGLGIGLMAVIGALACIVPTSRALRINPTEALRGL